MAAHSLVIAVVTLVLEATLILRARQGKFLSAFPLFYSYVAYMFPATTFVLLIYWLRPEHYANVFWFHFMITLVAEFAVLMEISDHIFAPYAAVRQLGRFLTITVCAVFFIFYVFPPLLESRPSDVAITELVKRSSLTKGLIIIVLLAAARYSRLPVGRNVAGIMLGFAIYLGTNVANFALLEKHGAELYGPTFGAVGPVSFTLCLLVWTIAMWRYEPALAKARKPLEASGEFSQPLGYQLWKFNSALTRFLRK
jgi:hypothetical protein